MFIDSHCHLDFPEFAPELDAVVARANAHVTYPARVQRVGAKVDPVSQTVKVHAEIEGNFPELIAGMSGRASFANANAR